MTSPHTEPADPHTAAISARARGDFTAEREALDTLALLERLSNYTLESVQEPTDSESADAEFNPDIWELRRRIDWLLSLIAEASS